MAQESQRLGQQLVERGWITGEQLIRAIQSQRAVGGRIGTCLLEMDVLSEDRLLDALAEQLRVPSVRIDQLRGITPDVLSLVPSKVAVRCQAVPFAADAHEVKVATLNVHNLAHLDEIASVAGRRVRPYIANEARIFEALEKYYGVECPRRYGHLLDRLNRSRYMWDESAKVLLGEASGEVWGVAETPILSPDAAFATGPSERGSATSEASEATARKANGNGRRARSAVSAEAPEQVRTLTLKEVERRLSVDVDLPSIGLTLLRFLAQSFERCALFKVQQDRVVGWLGHGAGFDRQRFERLEIDLDEPSIFLGLASGTRLHRGPLAPLPAHRRLAKCWGDAPPADCVVLPVRLRDRLVCALYGDRGGRSLDGLRIEQLERLGQRAATAFELCILRRKVRDV